MKKMKKVVRLFGLACMAGLLAFTTSCKKKDNTQTSIKISMPHMTRNVMDGGERAYIDDEEFFQWNEEDNIMVYNLSDNFNESRCNVFSKVSGQGAYAQFAGTSVGAPMTYKYFYFYPINMVSGEENELKNDNRQTFTVSDVQYYEQYESEDHPVVSLVDGTAMPMAINTDDLSASATLLHMFGIAEICLKAKRNHNIMVKSVKIIDNKWNLHGTCSVKLHCVDTEKLWTAWNAYANNDMAAYEAAYQYISQPDGMNLGYEGHGQGKEITMDCMHFEDGEDEPVGVYLYNGSKQVYDSFFFMLRPLALSNGFQVVVEYVDNNGEDQTMTIDKWIDPDAYVATGTMQQPTIGTWSIMPSIINTFRYTIGIE